MRDIEKKSEVVSQELILKQQKTGNWEGGLAMNGNNFQEIVIRSC